MTARTPAVTPWGALHVRLGHPPTGRRLFGPEPPRIPPRRRIVDARAVAEYLLPPPAAGGPQRGGGAGRGPPQRQLHPDVDAGRAEPHRHLRPQARRPCRGARRVPHHPDRTLRRARLRAFPTTIA